MKSLIFLLSVLVVAFGRHVARPRLDGRIIGGQEVDIADYPYQVSVRIYDEHICGGSILDESTVLTAAHCVYGMDHSKYSVRVGNSGHNLGDKHDVEQVIQHENYDADALDNDMAILKLAKALNFNDNTQLIELQAADDEVPVGTTAWVSGWGTVKEGNEHSPYYLRAVDVDIISTEDCQTAYGKTETISSHMMCAQTIGHDSCQGDSGGPLAANGKLIGVVSWGYGCARPQYPGVYAKVSDMYQWIVDNK